MKLNTLLLTSAATLMATTVAFAADLPSKKAAASSGAVQICKVGGMTGFTLPGSDTCLQISGRVTVDFKNSDLNSDYFGYGTPFGADGGVGYRLNFDARTNSEMGVIRSYLSLTNNWAATGDSYETGARKAFVQIGGFTAGVKDSLADISGTQGNLYGSGTSQTSYGVDYQVAAGGLTLAIGAEMSMADQNWGSNPDLIARVSGSAGDVNYKIAGIVANDDNDESTYAVIGHIDMKLGGGLSAYAFAGYGDAPYYVADANTTSGEYNSVIGGGLTVAASSKLSLTLEGRVSSSDYSSWNDASETSIGLFANYALAKNLSIQPEVVVTSWDGSSYTGAMVRIQRDF